MSFSKSLISKRSSSLGILSTSRPMPLYFSSSSASFSLRVLWVDLGTMPWTSLYFICSLRLLRVVSYAFLTESVMSSTYIITRPLTFLAARPIVCISDVSFLRNPSLSASRMATKDTSGKSRPSLKRFTPTNTSNLPLLKSSTISILSNVSISECIYLTLTPILA